MSENLYYTAVLIGFVVLVCWLCDRHEQAKKRETMTEAERYLAEIDRQRRSFERAETGVKVFGWIFWIGLFVCWIGIDGILASAGIMVMVVFIVLAVRTIWESGQ